MKYKGYQGYEEYDEEEKMIFGIVRVGEKSLTYEGKNLKEVKSDFIQKIEQETAFKGNKITNSEI